ncbi:hypothetical protein [Burkholderia anthina]|uniref:hypothetical protein n=1 Tax=Burkholderia anthina TaxID=179879 RepID=UPI001AA0428C|nr:hypothetical protein [Burkholderia anthina]QTD94915.1 hypothetical protein J4G50_33330 [Burkholderia anthina]
MWVSAAVDGMGMCLERLLLVRRALEMGTLVAFLGFQGVCVNGGMRGLPKSRADLPKPRCFQDWLFAELAGRE